MHSQGQLPLLSPLCARHQHSVRLFRSRLGDWTFTNNVHVLFTTTILGTFFFLGINPLRKISFENKNITTSSVLMDHRQSSCFASDFLETVKDPLKQESTVIPAVRVTGYFRKRVASGNAHGTWSIAPCTHRSSG